MKRLKDIYTKEEISNHMYPFSGEDILEEYAREVAWFSFWKSGFHDFHCKLIAKRVVEIIENNWSIYENDFKYEDGSTYEDMKTEIKKQADEYFNSPESLSAMEQQKDLINNDRDLFEELEKL